MNLVKHTFYLLSVLNICFTSMYAQTIGLQVINSAGEHKQLGSSNLWITNNVGEIFTETMAQQNLMITQGFLQPLKIDAIGFKDSIYHQNSNCIDKNDSALISITLKAPANSKNYQAKYFWSKQNTGTNFTPCPSNNCSTVDSLSPGNYNVLIAITYTNNVGNVKFDTLRSNTIVIETPKETCKIKIYNGINLSGNGTNDRWFISNISEFDNKVYIYSRWGAEIFSTKNYNNNNNYWPTPEIASKLSAGTYFYIIDLGDGTPPIKGWVELFKSD